MSNTEASQASGRLRLSCEFFPPRTADAQKSLDRVAARLGELDPDFFSCTYGAGGSTRDGTLETIRRLLCAGMNAAPHLSIGRDDEAAIRALLDAYRDMGVKRIVALRGDVPSGVGRARFVYNAQTLVEWIRAHSGDYFQVEVAAYPETHPDARSPEEDLDFFAAKVRAGASGAITQYFYNPHAFYDFAERVAAAGIAVPLVPGIMPITSVEGILRFSDKCGADVPRWLRKRLESMQDDEASVRSFGIDVVTRLAQDLIDFGVPGLHFYTLNRWGATLAVCRNLGIDQRGR